MSKPIYARFAHHLEAIANCVQRGGMDHAIATHWARIDELMQDAPSGSGIDAGTALARDLSKPDRLVFTTSFHHMNEVGMYDGWTHHNVVVTPSLAHGYCIRVTGRDRNGIKDYLADVFHFWMGRCPVD